MKFLIALCLIAITIARTLPGNSIRVTYVDGVNSWWGGEAVAAAIAVPGYAQQNLYTVVNLAFLLSYGPADALTIWQHPFRFMEQGNNPFGTTENAVRRVWLDKYHQAGVKIMASAFGATEFPTSAGYQPESYCTTLAQFVIDNQLDGIDLDWEDNQAMENGTGEDWLIRCTKAIRKILPQGQYLLTHAPQAPYFVGTRYYKNGGYLKVHQEVGYLIDWYNIQFYNQGEKSYDTYQKLFISSGGFFSGTSVKEMMNSGIPKEKIVIGKPVNRGDVVNTGLVLATDLHNWAFQASTELGWQTGIMDWQYSSDLQGNFVHQYING